MPKFYWVKHWWALWIWALVAVLVVFNQQEGQPAQIWHFFLIAVLAQHLVRLYAQVPGYLIAMGGQTVDVIELADAQVQVGGFSTQVRWMAGKIRRVRRFLRLPEPLKEHLRNPGEPLPGRIYHGAVVVPENDTRVLLNRYLSILAGIAVLLSWVYDWSYLALLAIGLILFIFHHAPTFALTDGEKFWVVPGKGEPVEIDLAEVKLEQPKEEKGRFGVVTLTTPHPEYKRLKVNQYTFLEFVKLFKKA